MIKPDLRRLIAGRKDKTREEIIADEQQMLKYAGWTVDEAVLNPASDRIRCWTSPRGLHLKYTQRAAVDIEELREGA